MATFNNHRNVHGATLTRRQFVKTGGALIVGFSLAGRSVWDKAAEAAAGKNSLDATLASSWFEIHADNTILMRTGKVDFGQTTAEADMQLTDTFTYTVRDPGGLTDTAQLVVTINGNNDTPAISGGPVTLSLQEDVTTTASGAYVATT